MAPLPKKKHTRSRTGKRRARTMAFKIGSSVKCENCGKLRFPHRACPHCGAYGPKG
ncbi:50S ribosomal protein L32 [Candidatus Woesebacteria bacterium RIFCSPHIGHO2_12_FULL_46_16]|uniref:Large ribosomal subunit protein bL32 n=1 Tax=Candidatus Woesebacteria bacterium RIFCSPHIGHO2_12_FULL_46_16 TaxID=1802513 RepID=A0A1F8B0R5_9BACT|nr:MAG: 50S ribosomal protein L32 [Candidatus Woesebacteria bacterium RIFCSPHIGHO2_12_FULL_46_16]